MVEEFFIDSLGHDSKKLEGIDENSVEYRAATIMNTQDFGAVDIKEVTEDEHGTSWNKRLTDYYRFIIVNGNPQKCSVILVYKNDNFLKKIICVNIHEIRTEHVDKNLCQYTGRREQIITYSAGSKNIVTVIADFDSNSGSIYFSFDNKSQYSGIYKPYPNSK